MAEGMRPLAWGRGSKDGGARRTSSLAAAALYESINAAISATSSLCVSTSARAFATSSAVVSRLGGRLVLLVTLAVLGTRGALNCLGWLRSTAGSSVASAFALSLDSLDARISAFSDRPRASASLS